MKKIIPICITIILLISMMTSAQVVINGDAATTSAGLDVAFTNKGFLPPRVALSAINSATPVTSPAAGLLVFNTAIAGNYPDNVVPGYYYWNGNKWISVSGPKGVNPGDMRFWNGTQWITVPAGINGQILILINGVPTWGKPSNACGTSLTVNHEAGVVAPVAKTVTYGTVANIPGEPGKCWITRNLGASQQAASANDGSEAASGWYWQFNRKQGYKHDGTTRTPGTSWLIAITEDTDWTLANDPCTIELGAGWRIPTTTEWINVDAAGSWTNTNGPWSSALKLHTAGNLVSTDGSLMNRGVYGDYWSSTQSSSTNGWFLFFSGSSCALFINVQSYAFPLRCIRGF
jgi:hypothetical protein